MAWEDKEGSVQVAERHQEFLKEVTGDLDGYLEAEMLETDFRGLTDQEAAVEGLPLKIQVMEEQAGMECVLLRT